MKLVFIDTTIHERNIGGAQIYLPTLLHGFVSRGDEVHLVASEVPNELLKDAIVASGVKLHTDLWSPWSLPIDKAHKLADWMNKLNPSLYIVSVSADVGWLVIPLLNQSIRAVAIAHSNTDAFYFPAAHYRNYLSGVIGVSEEICLKYESVSGINKNKIRWIPYGVRAAQDLVKRSEDEVIRLIYVGRLEEEHKRISDVKKLIEELFRRDIPFFFMIVGDGSMKMWLEKELATFVKSGVVRFLGWINNEKIQHFLQDSDVYVLTSSSEGFSIALTEAMATGCCPVVTDIPSGSVHLITDGSNGYLIPVGDVSGFADKIVLLSNDRNKLQELRKSAWQTGKQYSIEVMVDRYATWFSTILKNDSTSDRYTDPSYPVMATCLSKYPDWLRKMKLQLKRFMKTFQ